MLIKYIHYFQTISGARSYSYFITEFTLGGISTTGPFSLLFNVFALRNLVCSLIDEGFLLLKFSFLIYFDPYRALNDLFQQIKYSDSFNTKHIFHYTNLINHNSISLALSSYTFLSQYLFIVTKSFISCFSFDCFKFSAIYFSFSITSILRLSAPIGIFSCIELSSVGY